MEYGVDPRQAAKLIEDLASAGKGVKVAASPGVKCTQTTIGDYVLLAIERHIHFRGHAARANDLSADRPASQLAAKEICKWMSAPTELAMTALR